VCVLGSVVACGGGDGGGGGVGPRPEGPFLGSYHYVLLDRDGIAGTVRSETGQVQANGLGTLEFGSAYAAEGGAVMGPFTPSDLLYAVTGGRDLVLTESGGRTMDGVVAADGLLASAAALVAGDDPGTMILMRRATAPAQADLAGNWHVFAWGRSAGLGQNAHAAEAHVAIDAVGAYSVSGYHYNVDGVLDPNPTISRPEVLLVEPGGWLVQRRDAAAPILQRGGISEGRDLILLGVTGGSAFAGVTILIRAGQASSTSAFSGDYRVSGFESMVTDKYASTGGPLSTGAVGTASWLATYNADSSTATNTINLAFTVNADGTADFNLQAVVDTRGALGPGGRYAAWSGYFTTGGLPTLQFLIR